jgi:peptidoglycan-associated lipoprotein
VQIIRRRRRRGARLARIAPIPAHLDGTLLARPGGDSSKGGAPMRNQMILSLLLLAGCAHKQAETARATSPPQPAAAAPSAARQASCAADLDCQPTQLCVERRCANAAELPQCSTLRVHFDFDRSDLHAADQPGLDLFARCVKAQPATHFVIAGNCDERGTEEYNMALGDRRANAVVGYLTAIGAPKERLRAVSYGEEQPICEGHDESCWWQNRRAQLDKETSQAAR